jgi:hypothetical protein
MDDLPDIDAEHRFAFSADLAEILVPAEGPAPYPVQEPVCDTNTSS